MSLISVPRKILCVSMCGVVGDLTHIANNVFLRCEKVNGVRETNSGQIKDPAFDFNK